MFSRADSQADTNVGFQSLGRLLTQERVFPRPASCCPQRRKPQKRVESDGECSGLSEFLQVGLNDFVYLSEVRHGFLLSR